jgi:hypothetical protein
MVFIIQFKWVKTVGGIQIELGRKILRRIFNLKVDFSFCPGENK